MEGDSSHTRHAGFVVHSAEGSSKVLRALLPTLGYRGGRQYLKKEKDHPIICYFSGKEGNRQKSIVENPSLVLQGLGPLEEGWKQ